MATLAYSGIVAWFGRPGFCRHPRQCGSASLGVQKNFGVNGIVQSWFAVLGWVDLEQWRRGKAGVVESWNLGGGVCSSRRRLTVGFHLAQGKNHPQPQATDTNLYEDSLQSHPAS
jgi:hypothetical protein